MTQNERLDRLERLLREVAMATQEAAQKVSVMPAFHRASRVYGELTATPPAEKRRDNVNWPLVEQMFGPETSPAGESLVPRECGPSCNPHADCSLHSPDAHLAALENFKREILDTGPAIAKPAPAPSPEACSTCRVNCFCVASRCANTGAGSSCPSCPDCSGIGKASSLSVESCIDPKCDRQLDHPGPCMRLLDSPPGVQEAGTAEARDPYMCHDEPCRLCPDVLPPRPAPASPEARLCSECGHSYPHGICQEICLSGARCLCEGETVKPEAESATGGGDDVAEFRTKLLQLKSGDDSALADALLDFKELRRQRDDLQRFKDEWSAKDGNSPGYNLEKAKNYGTQAAQFKVERDEARRQRDEAVERSGNMEDRWGAVANERDALAKRNEKLEAIVRAWRDGERVEPERVDDALEVRRLPAGQKEEG